MSPVSRRILIYWLLLLGATLAVGAGALQLLRREQGRLEEQSTYASEARRAAITARAGLIVENIELLIGDVQTGLLDALAALPENNDVHRGLSEWSRTNPLVRVAFRARSEGAILHAAAATDSEEVNGFRRRVAAAWGQTPPWRMPEKKEADAPTSASFSGDVSASVEEQSIRDQASFNVSKLQSARRDAQLLARGRDAYAAESAPAAASVRDEGERAREVDREFRRGWQPWTNEGRMHVFGWIARTSDVLGVELELAALIARLGAALPGETAAGEGFAVLDERGRVMHQVGFVPRDLAGIAQIPLARSVLPGWHVVAFQDQSATASVGAGGLFLLGSVLVAILLVAILAGGWLLFRQARRSEADAEQKTSFVANVSHEFKTPLTTIRLYAELLEHGRVADAERSRDYLRTIGRETQRLARLVGNVLDFSRLEQERKKFARETVDLRVELERLLATQTPRFAELGLALQTELPGEEVAVSTDRDAVEQIVLNLIDNAQKYGGAGGEVLVRLRRGVAGGAQIEVLDRGAGVPPEHRARIFEKFHRVNDALNAEHAGAGLGLSIARQLARGLGGDLHYSPRDGGGSAFILDLP